MNKEATTTEGGVPRRCLARAGFGLAIYLLLNVAATICFKESGTDAERTWFYFMIGNIFGPLSLIFLMQVYSSMDANLGAALAMGLGAVSAQACFWLVYAVTLSTLQWIGIGMVIGGAVIAVSSGRNAVACQECIGELNS